MTLENNPPSLISEKEAARFLGLAIQTLRNWRHLRRGPVYHALGRRRLYKLTDLEAYLEQRRVEPEG